MAEICSCNDGIENFGQPGCLDSIARDSRLIFVNYLAGSGAVNSIKSTDTLDASYFEGKFNNTDVTQRWYITETINNVIGERDDNVTQDIDTINFNVRQGNRMYDGTFYGGIASPKFVGVLESMSCQQMGFFIVDVSGSIIGMEAVDSVGVTELRPIKIQRSTLQVKYKFPSATELQNINLKFEWEENERDKNINQIPSNTFDVDMLTQKSMSTVEFGAPSNITTTTFTAPMTYVYGGAFNKQAYEGAVIGDFTLLDTGGSPIAITTVTPQVGNENIYDVVFPLQPAGDISLSYQKTTGVGFESKESLTVTIV